MLVAVLDGIGERAVACGKRLVCRCCCCRCRMHVGRRGRETQAGHCTVHKRVLAHHLLLLFLVLVLLLQVLQLLLLLLMVFVEAARRLVLQRLEHVAQQVVGLVELLVGAAQRVDLVLQLVDLLDAEHRRADRSDVNAM